MTYIVTLILAASLILMPAPALANAGVPMLFITLPAMLVALLPIIFIEMFVLKVMLDSTWRQAALVSSVANAASTLVGVPLAWFGFLAIEGAVGYPAGYFDIHVGPVLSAIVFAAWLGPSEQDLYWMVPFSSMVLLVGYFYISYFFEKAITARLLKDRPAQRISLTSWRANLVSYALLELLAGGFLVYSIVTKKPGI